MDRAINEIRGRYGSSIVLIQVYNMFRLGLGRMISVLSPLAVERYVLEDNIVSVYITAFLVFTTQRSLLQRKYCHSARSGQADGNVNDALAITIASFIEQM